MYNQTVEIAFDSKKNERNLRERGLSFERAIDFGFETAITGLRYGAVSSALYPSVIWINDCT